MLEMSEGFLTGHSTVAHEDSNKSGSQGWPTGQAGMQGSSWQDPGVAHTCWVARGQPLSLFQCAPNGALRYCYLNFDPVSWNGGPICRNTPGREVIK